MLLTGLSAAFFYMFSLVAVTCSVMVVVARNPVHSVLYLIAVFFNTAALFILTGAEFLGMILLAVYVGAVAVLFLFVVMMLEVNRASVRQGIAQYAPVGVLIGIVIAAQLLIVVIGQSFAVATPGAAELPMPDPAVRHNTAALGDVLYTDYVYFFQIAGMVLLVAMIGAIVLTLRDPRPHVKRQDIGAQVGRDPEKAIELVDVDSGKGL